MKYGFPNRISLTTLCNEVQLAVERSIDAEDESTVSAMRPKLLIHFYHRGACTNRKLEGFSDE